MQGLPSDWGQATLGEVARWGSGGTPKAGTSRYYGGAIPWAVIGDLTDGVVHDTAATITEEGLRESSAKMIEPGTLLVAMYGSIGKLGIAGRAMATNQAIAFAVPDTRSVSARYLFHYLRSQREALSRAGKGATQQNISQTVIKAWPIPVPSFDEQQRIVEVLEAQLSRLDAALASVQEVRRKAAQFRRSLLQAVFGGSGLLEELPICARKTLPLAELLEVSIGGIWGEPPGSSELDVSVIRVTEMRPQGAIDPSTAATRSITEKQLASRSLQEGDLLLEKSGGGPNTPVGRVGWVPQLDRPSVCSNFMMLMRADAEKVHSRYLHLYLTHLHDVGGTIPLQTASTNIRNIKTKEYLQIPVPVPVMGEQIEAVAVIERHLTRLQATLVAGDLVEARCAAFRRSLLHAAFTGQLTAEWREEDRV